MRNFPCLTFQIFRIRIDAQVDDGWRVSSGSIFSKLNLTKFDKIKFQKSWHQTMMLKQRVGGDVQLILEKLDISVFFLTPKDAWQRYCLIEIWKFLEFTQGSLQERSSLLLSPISSIKPQAKLAPRSAMRGRILTKPLSNMRDFTGNMSIPVCPSTTPQTPLQGWLGFPSRPQSSSTRSPFPILPRPQARYGSGTACRRPGQDAWWRTPGHRSPPFRAPVGW